MKRFFLLLSAAAACLAAQAQTKLIINPDHHTGISKNGVNTAELSMQFAHAIEEQAKAKGIEVIITHSEKEYADVQSRAKLGMGEDNGHTFFLSVHMNTAKDAKQNGQQVIIERTPKNMQSINFGKQLVQKMEALGPVQIENQHLEILGESLVPVAVYSPGYISNADDLKKLKTTAYQQRVAMEIVSLISER